MAEVVSTVDEEVSVVLLGDLLIEFEVRRVSIHGEKSLSYNQDGIVRVSFSGFLQHPHHFVLVEVLKLLEVSSCSDCSFLKTIVRDMVHDDVIPRSNEGFDHSKASHPASSEYQHVHSPIFFELFLKLSVESNYL